MKTVDEYLGKVSDPQKTELERIRNIIKQTVPDAEEVITYGMPGFKYKGKYLIAYAQFKNHMSIFPGSEPIEVLRDKLRKFKISKGTVQFTTENPIPKPIITDLVESRRRNIDS